MKKTEFNDFDIAMAGIMGVVITTVALVCGVILWAIFYVNFLV